MNRYVIAAGFLVFLLGAYATHLHLRNLPAPASHSAKYWEQRIKTIGGVAAYGEFVSEVGGVTTREQHPLAHEFGSGLYASEGISGLSVCDDRFGYGCAHAFIARAVGDKGLESISDLGSACKSSDIPDDAFGCSHAIGHGILAYLGYDEADLNRTLSICAKLSKEQARNCYGGAFMEYNTRLMSDAKGRPAGDPFTPCNSFSAPYLGSCVFWQPQWWQGALFGGDNDVKTFMHMGALCREFPMHAHITPDICFAGIGFTALGSANGEVRLVRELCDSAGDTRSAREQCLIFAGAIKNADSAYQVHDGITVCDYVENSDRDICKKVITEGIEAVISQLATI